MNDLKGSLRDTMPKGIAAFRIPITRLEGKAKLSQNKPIAERMRVMEKFQAQGDTAIALAMKEYVEKVS
jgi:transcriptional regulator